MKTTDGGKDRGVQVFSMTDNECVWMKAGVVNFKLCDNGFDCMTCAFDKAITRKADQRPTALVSWREVKRGRPYFQRECRHMLTGRVQFKFCARNYECRSCEYDQMLDEESSPDQSPAVYMNKVAGFGVADGYYYHEGHSWARIEHGGYVRMGIDDFALRLLGKVSEIFLPKIGSRLKQGENGWSVCRGKMGAEVLSPMSGTVMATNQDALRRVDLVKKDPYGRGWLLVVDPRGGLKKHVQDLLFEKTVVSWLHAEVKKLEDMVAAAYGTPLAASGGEIVEDIFGNLPHLKWEELVHEFLRT